MNRNDLYCRHGLTEEGPIHHVNLSLIKTSQCHPVTGLGELLKMGENSFPRAPRADERRMGEWNGGERVRLCDQVRHRVRFSTVSLRKSPLHAFGST